MKLEPVDYKASGALALFVANYAVWISTPIGWIVFPIAILHGLTLAAIIWEHKGEPHDQTYQKL